MRGKIHGEPRIADSSEEYCSHSKNVSNDIPAFLWRSRRTTRKPIQDCGLRLFVAVEPIHLIRNHASALFTLQRLLNSLSVTSSAVHLLEIDHTTTTAHFAAQTVP